MTACPGETAFTKTLVGEVGRRVSPSTAELVVIHSIEPGSVANVGLPVQNSSAVKIKTLRKPFVPTVIRPIAGETLWSIGILTEPSQPAELQDSVMTFGAAWVQGPKFPLLGNTVSQPFEASKDPNPAITATRGEIIPHFPSPTKEKRARAVSHCIANLNGPHNTELSGEGPRPSAWTSSVPTLCYPALRVG